MHQTILLTILGGMNLAMTLIIQAYILYYFGPSEETDSYMAGLVIPSFILAVVSTSISQVLIPIFNQYTESKNMLAWTFSTIIVVISFLLTIILFSSAKYWATLLFPGFSREASQLVSELSQIQTLSILFLGLTAVLTTMAQVDHRFYRVEISSIISSAITLILAIILIPLYGIRAAAWLVVLKAALNTAIMSPLLGNKRSINIKHPAIVIAWSRFRPLLIGTSIYKTGPIIDSFLASFVPAGGLSILSFMLRLITATSQIIGKAFAVPALTYLSALTTVNKHQEFIKFYRNILAMSAIFILLAYLIIMILIWIFGTNLFNIFLLNKEHQDIIWSLLIGFFGVAFGGVIGQIATTASYAKGDTLKPVKIGVFGFAIGVMAKVIGFEMIGLLGIAAGASLHYLINAYLNINAIEKKIYNAQSHT